MKDDRDIAHSQEGYPVGRGYGHDYMRGGEVFGGYGYSEREEYALPRGLLKDDGARAPDSHEEDNNTSQP